MQCAFSEQAADGVSLLENAAVGVVLQAVKLAASIEKVIDLAK
jgi:hypothetical protein